MMEVRTNSEILRTLISDLEKEKDSIKQVAKAIVDSVVAAGTAWEDSGFSAFEDGVEKDVIEQHLRPAMQTLDTKLKLLKELTIQIERYLELP